MRLLKFEAEWCSTCKQVDQLFEKVTMPFPVDKINIELNQEATIYYGVRTLPTIILLDENNNILKKHVGSMTIDQLQQLASITE